jgi:hypothetical protein
MTGRSRTVTTSERFHVRQQTGPIHSDDPVRIVLGDGFTLFGRVSDDQMPLAQPPILRFEPTPFDGTMHDHYEPASILVEVIVCLSGHCNGVPRHLPERPGTNPTRSSTQRTGATQDLRRADRPRREADREQVRDYKP